MRVLKAIRKILSRGHPPFLIEANANINKAGRQSYHNGGFTASGRDGIEIGSFCAIAPNVSILGSNHDYNYTAMQYSFYRKFFDKEHPSYRFAKTKQGSKGKIIIGNDVWLAQNAVVLGGVTIGSGAIVGANAVVTRDVAPYSIVGGVPAREIKKRFSEEKIAFLEELKWWDWDDEKIKRNATFFDLNLNSVSLSEIKKVISE